MTERFELRQLVKRIDKNRLEMIFDTPCLRTAQIGYESACKDHPGEYFELVRVRLDEECLDYTKKPTEAA